MIRYRSKKKLLSLDECTRPYTLIFNRRNHPDGFFISINCNLKMFPIGKEVVLEENEFELFKNIDSEQHILPENKYDPIKE